MLRSPTLLRLTSEQKSTPLLPHFAPLSPQFSSPQTAAARIMKKYGGRVERVIRPTAANVSDALPYEVHVVTFPSHEQFEAYRADAELTSFATLRQTAIARTEILIGKDGEPYV